MTETVLIGVLCGVLFGLLGLLAMLYANLLELKEKLTETEMELDVLTASVHWQSTVVGIGELPEDLVKSYERYRMRTYLDGFRKRVVQ